MPKTLVLEPDRLIADDIAEIVRDLLPRAEIFVKSTLGDARKIIEAEGRWDVAIANNLLFQGPQNGLRAALDRVAAFKIMLNTVDEAISEATDDWISIDLPFSETSLRKSLSQWDLQLIGN